MRIETDTAEQETWLRRSARVWLMLLILFLPLGLARISHAATGHSYTYRTIDVPFTGQGHTHITGITDKGKLSGTYVDSKGAVRSWTYIDAKTGFRKLTHPKKTLIVEDINAWTRTVGNYFDGRQSRGFTLHSGHLHTLNIPGATTVWGCAINDVHMIVCTATDTQGLTHGVMYDASSRQVLKVYDIPGALWTAALGLNLKNDVVGAFIEPTPEGGDRYRGWLIYGGADGSGETVQVFDAPCGGDTIIYDINNRGLMAVTCENRSEEATVIASVTSYAFDGTTWTELAVPGAVATVVTRGNNAGQFVGWYAGQDEKDHGFIASPR
jgi:hypothetical protein